MPSPQRTPTHGVDFEAREAQLLELAEELFVTRGYAAVSMQELAHRAGISRPVVYRHFATKEDAFVACVRRARAAYHETLLSHVGEAATPREQLAASGDASFAMLEADPGRWRLLFATNAFLPGEQAVALERLRFETIELVAGVLRRNARDDVPDLLIEAAAHAISGASERLGYFWLSRPDLSRAAMVDLYEAVLWPALAPFTRDDTGPADSP